MMGESLSPVSTITYAALNVMWLDGLDDIRHVQTSAKGNDKADHVSIKWTCRSLDELQHGRVCLQNPIILQSCPRCICQI